MDLKNYMKRGITVDGTIVILVLLMSVIVVYSYLKKENTDYSSFVSLASEMKGAVKTVETNQSKLTEDQKDFASTTTILLSELGKKVTALELKHEPINVQVTYRKVEVTKTEDKKEVKPPMITPLLDRAGITKKRSPRVNQ